MMCYFLNVLFQDQRVNHLYLLSFLFEIFRQIILILADIHVFFVEHVLYLPFALCILYAHFLVSFGNWLIDWLIDWLTDWFALNSSLYGPNAPIPYRRALCVPYSDISSGQPCPLNEFPDGPQTQNINGLWIQKKKRKPNTLSFSRKKSGQANPLQIPQQGPLWREIPAYRAFLHISWYSSLSHRS